MTQRPHPVITEARRQGVEVWTAGGSIRHRPSVLPAELRQQLAAHKADVIASLTPPDYVVDRLRRWHAWLAEIQEGLLTMPAAGVGSDLETSFLRNLDAWVELESQYRPEWWDCVFGTGCPDLGPVNCQACVPVAVEMEAAA